MSIYRRIIRPLLFRLPAEYAYHLGTDALRPRVIWKALASVGAFRAPDAPTQVAGIPLRNPIGLAAGFDKDCNILPSLSTLGFGYLTCGTVTRDVRAGNPSPRLLRDTSREAIINSFGFPSVGLEVAAHNLERGRKSVGDTPIVASVSGTAIGDIVTCHRRLQPLSDAIEVNISSPNTAGLRLFHDTRVLRELLDAINEEKTRPLFIKMPPFPTRETDANVHDLILSLAEVCVDAGVDALSVANTQSVADDRLAVGSGGLSGRPILDDTVRMVSEVRARVGDAAAINACGGIFTAEDARRAMDAGADTVQLLTGMVYRGPRVAAHIARGLAEIAERRGREQNSTQRRKGANTQEQMHPL